MKNFEEAFLLFALFLAFFSLAAHHTQAQTLTYTEVTGLGQIGPITADSDWIYSRDLNDRTIKRLRVADIGKNVQPEVFIRETEMEGLKIFVPQISPYALFYSAAALPQGGLAYLAYKDTIGGIPMAALGIKSNGTNSILLKPGSAISYWDGSSVATATCIGVLGVQSQGGRLMVQMYLQPQNGESFLCVLEVQSSSLVKIISTRDVSATGRMSFGCPTDNYHYGILARKSGQGGFFLFRASRYKVDLIKSDIQPPSPDNEITACEGSMAVAAIKTSQGLELRRFLYTMSEREMKSDASIWKTGITSVAGVPLGQMLRLQMYSGTLYFMMDAGASKTGIFQISPDGNQTRWPDPPENPSNFFVTGAHSALVSTGSMIDGKAKLYLLGPKASYEPPSGNLTLSPNPGEAGKPAKLCWTTSGDVDSAVLQGYGPVDPKGGCMTVTPTTDTVYVLDLVGPAGTARAEARFVAVDPIAAYVPHDIKLYRYEANDPLNTISARMQMSLSFTNAASSFGQFGDAGTNFFRKLGSVSVSFCGADAILLRNSGNGWVDLVTPMEVAGKEQCDVVVSLDSPYGPAMSEPVKVNVVEENFAPFTNLVRLAADGTLDPASKLPYITKTITLSDGSRALAHIGPPEWSTPQTPLVAAQPGDELAAWGSGCGPAMITLGNEFTPDGATLQNPPQATLGGVGLETSGDFVYGFVGLCKVVFTVPAYFETEPKKPLQFNGKGEFTIPVEAAAGDGQ